jgi:hypothetical protein
MSDSRLSRRELNKVALASFGAGLTSKWARADEPKKKRTVDDVEREAAEKIPPLPFVAGSFTVAALPDTQVYCEKHPRHFYNQTRWIAENKDKHAIAFVTHLGDITNRNTKPQWEVAKKAMTTLDGVVPYSLVTGNHDCGPGGNATTRDTYLDEFFPAKGAKALPGFGGQMDDGRRDNAFHLFEAGGREFLVLALEWGPRDEVVAWADGVLTKHPRRRAILTTHAYMYYDDARYDWAKLGTMQTWNPHNYGTSKLPGGVNDGQELWDKLVAKHPNVFMTLNGHVLNDGLGRLTSASPAGGDVHQMLVNYQMKKEGGEGYLRLIEFLPDGETVQVKAYSPSTNKYKTDPQNQFVLKLKPTLAS